MSACGVKYTCILARHGKLIQPPPQCFYLFFLVISCLVQKLMSIIALIFKSYMHKYSVGYEKMYMNVSLGCGPLGTHKGLSFELIK